MSHICFLATSSENPGSAPNMHKSLWWIIFHQKCIHQLAKICNKINNIIQSLQSNFEFLKQNFQYSKISIFIHSYKFASDLTFNWWNTWRISIFYIQLINMDSVHAWQFSHRLQIRTTFVGELMLRFHNRPSQDALGKTRLHSSRMRTDFCTGCHQMPVPGELGRSPPRQTLQRQTPSHFTGRPLLRRQTLLNRQKLLKTLPSLAVGNKVHVICCFWHSGVETGSHAETSALCIHLPATENFLYDT